MGLHKGKTNNKDGRPKGSKNVKTIEWDNLGDMITKAGAERAIKIMSSSNNDDFMKYYSMLLEYFKPKQARVESNVTVNNEPLIIRVKTDNE